MESKNIHVLSFKYAFAGVVSALKQEPNLKFHFLAGVVAIIISFFLQISRSEWIVIIFLIGFVISLELTNTAIEAVVDHVIQTNHPGAKLAKDISAGAVLVAAATAATIGAIIWIT
ncbi:diacylglycerol kinase family protein [Candidatus Daviesbacteria bacterium]|nr:diacylglycerol kinase family protein [Candidatus Daviesbacteria bacterium]